MRAERLAAIGEMTVTLHHELNNPLMGALAEVELLLARPGQDAELTAAMEVVRTALLRMREIVKQAGDLQRADSTDYLSGLPMISLATTEAPRPVARGRAVLCAPDQELARATALLLRHAGFNVERASTIPEAEEEVGAAGHDAGGALGAGECGRSAAGLPSPRRTLLCVGGAGAR